MKKTSVITLLILTFVFNLGCVHQTKVPPIVDKPAFTFDGDFSPQHFFSDDYIHVQMEVVSESIVLLYKFSQHQTPSVAAIGIMEHEGSYYVIAYCYLNGINELKNYTISEGDGTVHYEATDLEPEAHKNFKDKLTAIYQAYINQGE